MKIIDFNKIEPQPNPHGIEVRKMLVNNMKNAAIVAKLMSGEKIDKHTAEGNAFFFVLEGKGIFIYDDKEIEVAVNTLIECPSNALRGWRNDSEGVLRFLVIKEI